MNTSRGGNISAWRADVARVERRVGGLAVVLGALALLSFVALDGTEHRLVVLAIAGLPALLGGGVLVVAGRMLERPGRFALMGQALPILPAGYWLLIIVSNRESIRARRALLIGAILLTLGCAITTGGIVKEGTTLTPLAGVAVSVVRAQDTAHVVDSTRSGALGDCTLHARAPDACRERFSLPPHLRILGQVDTLRNGSRIDRDCPLDVRAICHVKDKRPL